MVVDGYGCHTALNFGVKAKENQDKFLRCTGYLNSIKNSTKQDLLLVLIAVRPHNILNCLPHAFQLLNMLSKYCEKVYERSRKNLIWSIKNSGDILDKLKAKDFIATSLSTYEFSNLTLLNLII